MQLSPELCMAFWEVLLVGEAVEHTEHDAASLYMDIVVVDTIRLGVRR